jgi:starvation-inducible DNA-binding protein
MNMIYQSLIKLFCSLQVTIQKSHNFHWNVTGPGFYQVHQLLERIYDDLEGYTDRMAEHIRGYGRAPGAFAIFLQFSSVKENLNIPEAYAMLSELLADVMILKDELIEVSNEAAGKQSTLNLLGELDETLDTIIYLLSSNQLNFNI